MQGIKCACAGLLLLGATVPVSGQGVGFEWAKAMGSSSPAAASLVSQAEQGNGICVDQEGYVYTIGTFMETAEFGAGTSLVSAGDKDIFVSKTDPSGELVWAIGLGGSGIEEGMAITTDLSGNVYITGMFQDTVDFDPGADTFTLASLGEHDIFITKLTTLGEHVWTKHIGGDDVQRTNAISVDEQGHVYTTGFFCRTTPASSGIVDFDPGPGVHNLIVPAYNNAFVLKLDASGNFVWVRQWEADTSEGYGLAVSNGSVYTSGGFSGNADLNTDSAGFQFVFAFLADIYVTKLDTAGNFIWSRVLAGNNDGNFSFGFATSLAIDDAENVFTSGVFFGQFDFDPDPTNTFYLSATGYNEGFISKLDADGNFAWGLTTTGSSNSINFVYNLSTDAVGNLYATGRYSATTQFFAEDPDHTLTAAGNTDVFVTKLDTDGTLLWLKGIGGEEEDHGLFLCVDPSGNVYTTGFFQGVADFDPDAGIYELNASGSSDIFIHKLVCTDTNSSYLAVTACSFTMNGNTYTTTGVYTEHLTNMSGCDSTIIIDLTIDEPLPVITVDGFTLGTTIPYESYQWSLDGTEIPGATAATYTVAQNGSYSVAVTNASGCSGTSGMYEVNNYTGTSDVAALAASIRIYPNPAQDMLYVQSPVPVTLSLTGIDGRSVLAAQETDAVFVGELADGMYLLHISDKAGRLLRSEKIVKQK